MSSRSRPEVKPLRREFGVGALDERFVLTTDECFPVDGGDLAAFPFKTLPTQEFLVREQAMEENLYTSFTLFYSHFKATTD